MERGQNNLGINLSSIIFKIVYLIALASFLFFYFFAVGRHESYVHTNLINIKEFLITLPLLIMPLLLPVRGLKWRFFTFLGLAVPLTLLGMSLTSNAYPDGGTLIFFIYDFFILVTIVISHYLLRYIQTKTNNIAKIIGIVILLVILASYSAYFVPSKISYRNYRDIVETNYDLLNEIQCKGAYTTTLPSELASICNKIDDNIDNSKWRLRSTRENWWTSIKSHCNEVIEKIKLDKYYFDDSEDIDNWLVIRTPKLYRECPEPRIRPEVLDPLLCDHLDNDEMPGGSSCYARAAAGTGELELCKKTQFPHSCYEYVAKERKDPTICDNMQINRAGNIDEEDIEECKVQAK